MAIKRLQSPDRLPLPRLIGGNELVGSPLSLNPLREDLQVSHRTVAGWVAILERLYVVFRLPPFGAARIRAVKKVQKPYHFDWTLVPGEAQRFENLVASHLLKWVHFRQGRPMPGRCPRPAPRTTGRPTASASRPR